MSQLRALFLATSVVIGVVIAGCGGDDSSGGGGVAPGTDGGDTTGQDGGGTTGGGGGGNDAGTDGSAGPTAFPAYVKSLVETKTADNTLPEGEQAWGALTDDETPATSTVLFPASFFQ